MCSAGCEKSRRGNWFPAGTTKNLSTPWRKFPAQGPRLRSSHASTSRRSYRANRREAWPALQTSFRLRLHSTRFHEYKRARGLFYSRLSLWIALFFQKVSFLIHRGINPTRCSYHWCAAITERGGNEGTYQSQIIYADRRRRAWRRRALSGGASTGGPRTGLRT